MALSPALFPLVGLGIGAAVAGVNWAASLAMPPLPSAGLAVLAGTILTGAVHLDGLADATDGLFGGSTPARRLEIMRDPHVGVFGVIAVGLALILKTGAISSFTGPSASGAWAGIVLAPMLGRLAAVAVMTVFQYVRAEGTGSPYRPGQAAVAGSKLNLPTAAAFSAVASWVLAGPWGLIALAAGVAAGIGVGAFAARRLGGGVTGDVYGAAVETAEIAALLSFVGLTGAIAPVWG
jgi:adenosylcobinamide-GDP ribazoletransferase